MLGFEQWLTGYVIENEQDGKNDRISIEVKVLNEGFTSLGAWGKKISRTPIELPRLNQHMHPQSRSSVKGGWWLDKASRDRLAERNVKNLFWSRDPNRKYILYTL